MVYREKRMELRLLLLFLKSFKRAEEEGESGTVQF